MKRLGLPALLCVVAMFVAGGISAEPKGKKKNKPQAKKKAPSKAKMSKLFQSLDKNQDWELSFKELSVALDPRQRARAEKLFDSLQQETDANSQWRRTLNLSEFRAGYERLKAVSRSASGGKPKTAKKTGKKKKTKKKG